MSLENAQPKVLSNYISQIKDQQKEITNPNNPETNLLFKPKAVKQNIINKTQITSIENKFPNIPLIYQNPLQTQEIQKNNNVNEKGAFSLLVNNNINNKNNLNINYIKNDSNNAPIPNSRIHCTCKKTKCVKKYCECFSSGNLCYNCKCENCENKPYFIENKNNLGKKEEENNNEIIDLNEEENEEKKLIICTCSKSGCNKNYCECFKAKVKCNNKCRCIKCLNKQEEKKDNEEKKIIMRSKSSPVNLTNNNNNISNNNVVEYNNNTNNSNINTDIANSFTVHRISVVISKAQTLINTEKLDSLESHKFLNKKRNIC